MFSFSRATHYAHQVIFLGVFLATTVLVSCGIVLLYPVQGLLTRCAPHLRQLHAQGFKALWAHVLLVFFRYNAPSRVVITMDETTRARVALPMLGHARHPGIAGSAPAAPTDVLLSNHQCDLDWIVLWYLGYALHRAGQVVILLKDSISRLPLFGQVCACAHASALPTTARVGDPVHPVHLPEAQLAA